MKNAFSRLLCVCVCVMCATLAASCGKEPPVVTEPVTSGVTEPATSPVTEPLTEPVTEPITEPATEAPVTEPVTEAPATEAPVTEAPFVPEPTSWHIEAKGNSRYNENGIAEYEELYKADITVSAGYRFTVDDYDFGKDTTLEYGFFSMMKDGKLLLRIPIFDAKKLDTLWLEYEGVENAYLYPQYELPKHWSMGDGKTETVDGLPVWVSKELSGSWSTGFTYTYRRVMKAVPIGMRGYVWLACYEYDFTKYPKEYEARPKTW